MSATLWRKSGREASTVKRCEKQRLFQWLVDFEEAVVVWLRLTKSQPGCCSESETRRRVLFPGRALGSMSSLVRSLLPVAGASESLSRRS